MKIPAPTTEYIVKQYLTLSDKDKKQVRDYLNYLLLQEAITRMNNCLKYMINGDCEHETRPNTD
jgi:hypothetical protein